MKIKLLIFTSIVCFSCSKIEPRKPINPKPSSTILQETLQESIKLNVLENSRILSIIEKDSTMNYRVSPNGYWYTYINKIQESKTTPKIGDVVSINYDISDLQGNIIYSKEELGVKYYRVDKEDFISALQTGIKLMKVGETITFVIPSYKAFGVSGDGKKIGINQSIKSKVTLININN